MDPRDDNCKAFRVATDGRIVGVELDYVPQASAKFELVRATLINEASAGGNTVATVYVYGADGLPASDPVYLAYPWTGSLPFANRLLPGNPQRPVQHVIINGYNPPAKGPLGIYVGTQDGAIISDVIAGLGLPYNRHVSYELLFRERGSQPPPGGDGDVTERLARIEADLIALRAHLGVPR